MKRIIDILLSVGILVILLLPILLIALLVSLHQMEKPFIGQIE